MRTELDTLIKACGKNDRNAQRKVYDLYASKMRAVCVRYCKNKHDAEDVLQEGFIKVFTNIGHFKWKGSFEGWMRRVFIGCAVNHLKLKETRMFRTSMEYDPARDDVHNEQEGELFFKSGEFEIENKVSVDVLIDMLQDLPTGYRLVFNMYAIEEYTHKEISRTLKISIGTSKSQLSKARKMLQERLQVYVQKLSEESPNEDRLLKVI